MNYFYLKNIKIIGTDIIFPHLSYDNKFTVDELRNKKNIILKLTKSEGGVIYDKFSIGGMYITPVVDISFNPSIVTYKIREMREYEIQNIDLYTSFSKTRTSGFIKCILNLTELNNGDFEAHLLYDRAHIQELVDDTPSATKVYSKEEAISEPEIETTEYTMTPPSGSKFEPTYFVDSDIKESWLEAERAERKKECKPPIPRKMGIPVTGHTVKARFAKPIRKSFKIYGH